jgi:hypothetical protein
MLARVVAITSQGPPSGYQLNESWTNRVVGVAQVAGMHERLDHGNPFFGRETVAIYCL